MHIHILGCGSSGGVPLISGRWGACNPSQSKNARLRSSIFIEINGFNILIDTSPDLRRQMLSANIKRIDAVLITHAHADHCHGLDELRQMAFHQKSQIPVFADALTLERVQSMFKYMFHSNDPIYPSSLKGHTLQDGLITIGGHKDLKTYMFEQHHGHQRSSGFRIQNVAYSTDVSAFPKASLAHLKNLDLWIVDCLRYHPHHTHAHFDITLGWIKEYRPKKAVLTHMSEYLDYDDILDKCQAASKEYDLDIIPAYDGLHLSAPA